VSEHGKTIAALALAASFILSAVVCYSWAAQATAFVWLPVGNPKLPPQSLCWKYELQTSVVWGFCR
jgi:hypothetical protein